MSKDDTEEKTLRNNSIRNFILRIDSKEFSSEIYGSLIEIIKSSFDRTEILSSKKLMVSSSVNKSELSESDHNEYKLVSSIFSSTLTLSEVAKAIYIECDNYVDYKSYKGTMDTVIEGLKSVEEGISANRIGMRFINEFKCANISQAKKVLNKKYRTTVSNLLQNEHCSRAVAIEEFNYSDMKSRVQYGVLNRFYPAVIANFDVSLDIDVYDDSINEIANWDSVIKNLNHKSYEIFVDVIDDKTILEMK